MKSKDIVKEVAAGLFFVVTLTLLVFFVLIIGKDKGIGQAKFQVNVLFNNVGGLNEGAPVRHSGVTIGNVDHIMFLQNQIEGKTISVTINVYEKYRQQLQNQPLRVTIKTEGVLGEKLMEIYHVETEPRIDISKPVLGQDPFDVQDLAEVFSDAAKSFSHTIDDLSQVNIQELASVMGESSEAMLVTAQGINAIMGELQDITVKAKRLVDRLEQKVIEGDLFTVF